MGKPAFSPSYSEVDAMSAPVSSGKRMPHVDRSHVDPQVLKAAEGMEAMFLDYLMKVMRQTVPKNDMDLESPATNIYRGMMDSEIAQKAAHRGGIGLAEQIIAYLDSNRYHHPQGHGVTAARVAAHVPGKVPVNTPLNTIPNTQLNARLNAEEKP
jgi:flagellar protein FlgJ